MEYLFRQTQFAYLDAPFPALFKERLFTYLSRFCAVPYCVVHHAAFLLGRGNATGICTDDILSPAAVVQLLSTPVPNATQLQNYLNVLTQAGDNLSQWPASGSELEQAIFFAAVSLFLKQGPCAEFRCELRRVLGTAIFNCVGAFLSFVRGAHDWTELHPELGIEPDVKMLLADYPILADWLAHFQSDAAGEHVAGTEETIAQLRRAVQHSATRQANLNDILEHSLNEIYLFDQWSLHFIHANRGALDNLGYSLEELQKMTPIDIKPEMTRDAFEVLLRPLRDKDKNKVSFVTRHQRKNGSTYPVEVHLQRAQFDSTPVYTAMILDITERSQTAAALAQARLFLESAPDATIIVNGAGKIEFVNSQTTTLFGYTHDELCGMAIETLVPPRFRDRHVVHRQHFAADSKARAMGSDLDLHAITKTGDEFPIEVSLSPIKTGDEVLVAATVRDISARKATERALQLAKNSAESANATKSRFLAAASHDLRQPLHSLSLYLSAMTHQLDQPEQRQVAAKMRDSLTTMGELLDALLDISRFEGDSVTAQKRDFDIKGIFERIVSNNIQQAERKGLQLECSSNECTVHSDPGLLERVIENFVTNAIRYTERGRVKIVCECGAGSARISVSDTGIGIPEAELDNVFEEFYQLNNPVRDRQRGLGLGLAIVQHISQLLDHSLNVSSVPGEGSTFSVYVPLGTTTVEQSSKAAPTTARSHGNRVPVVLVVDDDRAILEATVLLLELVDIEVHSVFNGDEALLQIAAGLRPDVILSDYRLPGYSGVELIRRVRQAANAELPALIMTGDTVVQEIEDASLANCTVLQKPVDTDRLIALIEQLTA